MSDYKPCPFCGGSARTHMLRDYRAGHWVDLGVDLVECINCCISTPPHIWNNRSPMAEVAEIMEEVKK